MGPINFLSLWIGRTVLVGVAVTLFSMAEDAEQKARAHGQPRRPVLRPRPPSTMLLTRTARTVQSWTDAAWGAVPAPTMHRPPISPGPARAVRRPTTVLPPPNAVSQPGGIAR